MLLQVGFKSLSYEMQEQQPAYDSNSLFGKKHTVLQLQTAQHCLAVILFSEYFARHLVEINNQCKAFIQHISNQSPAVLLSRKSQLNQEKALLRMTRS